MTDAAKIAAGLVALADRVEALAGPCIVTDSAIARLIGRGPDVDFYTASLDAAMTLVPKGWAHGYRWNARHKSAQAWCDFIPEAPFTPAELLQYHGGKCVTPALALTAAALRAIAAGQP
jgi:hypothetical protein